MKNFEQDISLIFFLIIGSVFAFVGIYMLVNAPVDGYNDFILIGLVFLVLGSIAVLVGLSPILKLLKKSKLAAIFFRKEIILECTVQNIMEEYSASVDGATSYKIVCSYINNKTYTYHLFYSEPTWQNPESQHPVGSTIPVYVNPKDYSKHKVIL